ncbi:MAG: DUF1353 domain-containing protein, partial [Candidatus Fermentibacteraceae bacterium]|nr:DUF1353 domain-containing protein [Candidatus Fermentibacteraceae bacterium]
NAAVVHDWLYWRQTRSRKESDRIMLEGMGVLRVPRWQKYPIYIAVRSFGCLAWKRNQMDRRSGFKRVLTDYVFKSTMKLRRPSLFRRIFRIR